MIKGPVTDNKNEMKTMEREGVIEISGTTVREVLERIAWPCRDDGRRFTETRRLEAITGCLGPRWKLVHDGALAKIYARDDWDAEKPTVVVSSHVDMVAERCYARCDGEVWQGSFDNLATNAAVTSVMMREGFPSQAVVAFTGDEEEDSRGADEVVRVLKGRGVNIRFVVVTDVTAAGWRAEKAFTMENLFPADGQAVASLLARCLPGLGDLDVRPKVIVDADCDEAWQYDEHDLKCCSVCLPCHGDMHSEEGVEVRGESAERYAEALRRIVGAV